MPQDNRISNRTRRRVKVRYGVGKPEKTGFTKNLSETGLCIRTNSVFKPGTTLQVEVQFPGRSFTMWSRVVWAKKVPPQLAHLIDCGMGVSFINPTQDWLDFYQAWKDQPRR